MQCQTPPRSTVIGLPGAMERHLWRNCSILNKRPPSTMRLLLGPIKCNKQPTSLKSIGNSQDSVEIFCKVSLITIIFIFNKCKKCQIFQRRTQVVLHEGVVFTSILGSFKTSHTYGKAKAHIHKICFALTMVDPLAIYLHSPLFAERPRSSPEARHMPENP